MRITALGVAVLWALAIVVHVNHCSAQPFGGGGFGGPGGGFGDRRGFSFGDPTERLKQRDVNNNGMLEPAEIDGGFQFFLSRMAERSNKSLDLSKPIPLNEVLSLFGQNDNSGSSSQSSSAKKPTEEDGIPLVPGFEYTDEVPLVPDFATPPDSPLLYTGPLENRYGPRIIERAERTLRAYDANKDDILDQDEIARGRSWDSDPKESDLNGDGRLTKIELCERYVARYGNDLEQSASSGGTSSNARAPTSASPPSSSAYGGSSGSPSSNSSSGGSQDDRLTRYAESIFRRYDDNRDGMIDAREMRDMSSGLRGADKGGDGNITRSEMVEHLRGYASSTASSSSGSGSSRSSGSYRSPTGVGGGNQESYRASLITERLAKMGLPKLSDFTRDDRNEDGQIQMSEFTSEWTESQVAKFRELDLNDDGVITPQEWLKVYGDVDR